MNNRKYISKVNKDGDILYIKDIEAREAIELSGRGLYIPTLSSAPTSSTTTYTKDGETISFQIGQFARVADSDADTGYVFWQLHDIQTENDVTTAAWLMVEGTPFERVRISLMVGSQSAPAALKNAATIKVTSTENGVVFNGAVTSDGISVAKIEPGDVYTVEASYVSGYQTPESLQFTAEFAGLNTVVFNYIDINMSRAIITASDQNYSGSALTPTPTVVLGTYEISSDYYDVSYNNNINAGTATITVEGKDGYIGTGIGEFTIQKIAPSYSVPTPKNLTYNGNAQVALNAGSSSDGTIMYSLNNDSWSENIPTITSAGTHTVYWKLVGDNNHTDVAAQEIEVTVAKVTPTITAPSAKINLVYDGSAQALADNGSTDFGTMLYSINGTDWTTTMSTGTNAQTYTLYYRVLGDSNVNNSVTQTITCSIAKAAPSYTMPASRQLIYNTQEQELLSAGSTSHGNIQYSADGETWGQTIPTGTNVGSYTSYWKLTGDSNHTDIVAQQVVTVISKLTPTVTAPTPKVLTYNRQDQELVEAGSTNFGTLKYSLDEDTWSTTIPTGQNYGTYTVYYKVEGNSNVNDVDSQSVACSIAEKRVTTPTIILSQNSYTYDGNECQPEPTVMDGEAVIPSSEYSVSYSNNVNVGTATVIISDNEGGNYYIIGEQVFTITKVTPTVTAPTAKTLAYSGNEQALVNAGSADFGTIQYSSDGETWGTSIPKGTNAGNYTVYYRVVGDDNINSVEASSIACAILKANLDAFVSMAGWTYGGVATDPSVSGNSGSGEVTYTYKSTSADDSAYSSEKPSEAGMYHVKAVIAETANYNGATVTNNFTIAKADPVYTAPTATSPTYDGEAKALLNAGSSSNGTVQYSADGEEWGSNIPTGTNAGIYTSYWRLIGDSNHNDVASTPISTTIARADISPSVSMDGWTYGETAKNPSVSGNTENGTVTYYYKEATALDSTYTITKPNNAGTYTVKAQIAQTTNYNENSATTDFIISKANLSASVSMSDWVYGSTASDPVVSGNSENGTVTYNYKVDGSDDGTYTATKPSNVGTYVVRAQIAATTNYNGTTVTDTFTISKANLSASVSMSGWTYGGTATSPSVSGNSGNGDVTYSYKVSTAEDSTYSDTKPSAAGTYTVRAQIAATANYNGTIVTTNFTIAKATPAYTAPTAKSLTYSGSAQALLNAGSSSQGTVQYSSNNSTWSTTIPTGTNAGSYTSYWRLVGDANHADIASTSVSTTIAKATGSATVSGVSLTYNGNSRYLVSVSGNTGTMYYRVGTSGSWTTNAPTSTNAGSWTIYYYMAESTNYGARGNSSSPWGSVSSSIAKADQSAPTATGATTTYNTTATATASGGGGQGTLTWTNGNTQTSVGSKTTKAYWAGNNNYNASPYSNEVTLTMNKAAGSVSTAPVNTNYTYNGTARVVASAGSGTGTMYYRLGTSGSFSTSMPTMTNAGSSTLYYYAAASTNYEQSSTGSITVSVQKADQGAPTASGASVNEGSTATASASGGGGQGSIEWSNGNTRTAVGSQTTQARWSGNGNYNASGWSNAVTLTVVSMYNGHDYVDLGLPSGTKWATMNIGATTNGFQNYGNYYMYGKGSRTYNSSDSAYTGMENPLSMSVDTARQVWGGLWHIPTKALWEELASNTTGTNTSSPDGQSTMVVFTSKSDSSKSISLPLGGYMTNGTVVSMPGLFGYYAISTPVSSSPYSAHLAYLAAGYGGVSCSDGADRTWGLNVRGVIG